MRCFFFGRWFAERTLRIQSGSGLRWRKLGDEFGELAGGGAFGGADVVAAGSNAGAETFLEAEAQQVAEAETGVEVVASAGADLGLGDERAGEPGACRFGGGGSAAARMD